MVMTPAVAVTTRGTQYSVAVANDGTTTVACLEGTVVVTDLASRESVILEANYTITVPKTETGFSEDELKQKLALIDHSSLDRWWAEEPSMIENGKTQAPLRIAIAIFIVIMIVSIIVGKASQKPKLK
ncbi:MAG: hypothetical protein V1906_00365, partial [Candidatus Woesearchaeota archaeon]